MRMESSQSCGGRPILVEPSHIPAMDPPQSYNSGVMESNNSDKDSFEYKEDDSQISKPANSETLTKPQSLINHPVGLSKNVSAFLVKLYNMVGDPSTDWLIGWSAGGTSFMVYDHQEFARQVLPMFFKHNNFASFVRQLNMYGFHKLPVVHQGMAFPRLQSEIWEFSHPKFRKNRPELLCYVQRKKSRDQPENVPISPSMGRLFEKVEALRNHQILISDEIKNLQSDYKDLYSRSIEMRNRYQIQQEKIDKIIKFIASLYSYGCDQVAPAKRKRLIDQQDVTSSFSTSYSPQPETGHVPEISRAGSSHQEEQRIQNLLPYISNSDDFRKNSVHDRNLVHNPLQQAIMDTVDSYNLGQNNQQALSLQNRPNMAAHIGSFDRLPSYRLPPEASVTPILRMLTDQKFIPQAQDEYFGQNLSNQRYTLDSDVRQSTPAVTATPVRSKSSSEDNNEKIPYSTTSKSQNLSASAPYTSSNVPMVRIRSGEDEQDYQNVYVGTQNRARDALQHTNPQLSFRLPPVKIESTGSPEAQNVSATSRSFSQIPDIESQQYNNDAKSPAYLPTLPAGLNSLESRLDSLSARSSAIKNAERSLSNEVEVLSSAMGSEFLEGLEDVDDFDDLYNFMNFDSLPDLDNRGGRNLIMPNQNDNVTSSKQQNAGREN